MKKRKVSIYDIAEMVHVSPATVSYVINGKGKISETTKKEVLKAMKTLGYTPDHAAVSLSTGKSGLIGLFLPYDEAGGGLGDNPFFSEFIDSFLKEISGKGYDLVLGFIKDKKKFLNWLYSRSFEGLAIFGLYGEELLSMVKKSQTPTVLVDCYGPTADGFTNIRTNDLTGVYQATNHLICQGHRNIAYMGGDPLSFLNQKRYQGYEKCLLFHDIPIRPDHVFRNLTTFEGGAEVADQLFPKLSEVTAIVSDADILSIGLIQRMHSLGVRIPERLSVIGFDDVASARYTDPGLTTISQDIAEKARLAAHALLSKIRGEEPEKKIYVVEPKLILRSSVCKPNL